MVSTASAFNIGGLFPGFAEIVVFGDSYSDTGNVYRVTDHTWPIVPPYYQGRYCDGPNWVDNLDVARKLDFAYGSATTDNNFVQGLAKLNTVPVPGFLQQVDQYLANPFNILSYLNIIPTLYVIWGGGNDFLVNNSITPPQIVNSLALSIKALLDAGAKNILVFNQPPLQALPIISAYNQNAYFAYLTKLGNDALNTTLKSFKSSYPSASICMFNLNALITKVLANSASTFTNTVSPCWTNYNVTTVIKNCPDPTKYVFIDNIHFTSPVQQQISDAIQPFISGSILGSYIIPY